MFSFCVFIVYMHKFQVSWIILTSFRQGVILPPPPYPQPQDGLLKSPPRLGLRSATENATGATLQL